jgi:putative Mn2+ efflux pump MntP
VLPKAPLFILSLALLVAELDFWMDAIGVGITVGIKSRLHRLKDVLFVTKMPQVEDVAAVSLEKGPTVII